MLYLINLADRQPVWQALASLYLDTELQAEDFALIAQQIAASPYSLAEAKAINRYEVFPTLYRNLLSIGGEWTGFDNAWLSKHISETVAKQNALTNLIMGIFYFFFKSSFDRHWQQIEMAIAKQIH